MPTGHLGLWNVCGMYVCMHVSESLSERNTHGLKNSCVKHKNLTIVSNTFLKNLYILSMMAFQSLSFYTGDLGYYQEEEKQKKKFNHVLNMFYESGCE